MLTQRSNANQEDQPVLQTIFYPGMHSSQTQMTKYTGSRIIKTSTGSFMTCKGKNNLEQLNVIFHPYIGKEIADVNTNPFSTYQAYFNPVNLISAGISRYANWKYGMEFYPGNGDGPDKGNVSYHVPNFSKISMAQETDILSHLQKYQLWKETGNGVEQLILYGVSRGAATTFNAMARFHYKKVKLVILEGCFYSVEDVIDKRFSKTLQNVTRSALSFFTQYQANGPSPAAHIKDFPENIPVVFISSLCDKEVPYASTQRLAQALADKGKNEVYLLTLNHSSHPNYMFDNKDDRDRYECFIHAIYKKYGLETYDNLLAQQGQSDLIGSLLMPAPQPVYTLK